MTIRLIARSVLGLATALMVCSVPGASVAASIVTTSPIGSCIERVSAHRPWLEKTLWGLFDQEGGWVGAEIANGNGTHDLGPLQVNSAWIPVVAHRLHRDHAEVRRWLQDDPCFNVGVAAWIFLSDYRRTMSYWRAVGAYHSPTVWRQRVYVNEVARRLRTHYGGGIFKPLAAVIRSGAHARRELSTRERDHTETCDRFFLSGTGRGMGRACGQ